MMPEHVTSLLKLISVSSRQSYLKCRRRCKNYKFTESLEQRQDLFEKQVYDSTSDVLLAPAPPPPANPQARSTFFTRLPPEIRHLIYEEAIGGNVFHFVKKADRLGFKACTGRDGQQMCYSDELWAIETSDGLWKDTTDGGPLSPLLSCRKLYVFISVLSNYILPSYRFERFAADESSHEEAIQILYTHSVFSFQSLSTILDLESILPPLYFHSITSLLLNWFLKPDIFVDADSASTRDLETWRRVWAVIADMRHLRDIKVTLSMVCMEISEMQEARILRPLRDVGYLRTFDVDVPWDASVKARSCAPYRLTKSGRRLKMVWRLY